MASPALPITTHHHVHAAVASPRHPLHAAPTSHPHCTAGSTSYYPSSASTHPSASAGSFWSIGPPSTKSSTSSSSPKLNAGLIAARHVTRLHRRSKSKNSNQSDDDCSTPVDDMTDEGFFSGPGSPPAADPFLVRPVPHRHHSATKATAKAARGKIKPLLQKVSGSRGNSLDLSRSDGGLPNGVGLGIYDGQGYDSSGVDEDMVHRHRRNLSSTSGHSPLLANPNQPFSHPKRQVPRRGPGVYTPDLSYNGTSNESSSDEDDDEDERETRRMVLQGSRRSTSMTRPPLHLSTHSSPILHTSMTRSGSHMTSPTSPSSPEYPPSATITGSRRGHRGRQISYSSTKSKKSISVRDQSPSVAASVTAARLAWEAKEEKKEAKRESKRRRSEAKEDERSRAASKCSTRGRGNSDSTSTTLWDADGPQQPSSWEGDVREKILPEHDIYRDPAAAQLHAEDEDHHRLHSNSDAQRHLESQAESLSKEETRNSRGRNATGRRWGVLGASRSNGGTSRRANFKKKWIGFFVWVRIGMVRLGRKMGF